MAGPADETEWLKGTAGLWYTHPMDEKFFRNKVTWAMFILSIFVIWIHAVNIPLFYAGVPEESGAVSAAGAAAAENGLWAGALWIQNFLAGWLGQAAVPGFFMVSSYLFFRTYDPARLMQKWKSRCFSVVIPYAVWNTLYYLGYAAATRIPGLKEIVGRAEVPLSLSQWLEAVMGYAYAPVFWFLFQLILLILLSPVLYYILKNRWVGLMFLAALLACLYMRLVGGFPNTDALIYYSAAGWLAIHGRRAVESDDERRRIPAGLVFLAASAVCFYEMQIVMSLNLLWSVGYRMMFASALWLLTPAASLPKARPWMKQSLYIYAVHFPVVRLMNKGGAMALKSVCADGFVLCAAAMALFFLIPVVVTAFSYGSALFLGRRMSAVWRILSGGRSMGQ